MQENGDGNSDEAEKTHKEVDSEATLTMEESVPQEKVWRLIKNIFLLNDFILKYFWLPAVL